MWLHQLWPYSREQDGAFVQLQAVLPPAGEGGAAGDDKAGDQGKAGGQRVKDAAKQGPGRKAEPPAAASAAEAVSRLWFVRLGPDPEGGLRVRAPHELPYDLALLPSLLRK
jgi:hypothetical protein